MPRIEQETKDIYFPLKDKYVEEVKKQSQNLVKLVDGQDLENRAQKYFEKRKNDLFGRVETLIENSFPV